jgi:LmbE family N-acetylglucosaminyl deacetylase
MESKGPRRGKAPRRGNELVPFADVKRAVVVCAHADDLETMMGGTAYLLAQRGVEIFELILTRGDLGTASEQITRDHLATLRQEEAKLAGEILGLRGVATLDYPDGELVPSLEVRAEIARLYREAQPDTLFTFDPDWPGQIHPDHRAAGRAAIDAFMPSKMRLYHPEQLGPAHVADLQRVFFFSPANPTIFVDVTGVYDRKMAASLAHASQFTDGEKSLEWMRRLDEAAAGRAGLEGRLVEQFSTLRLW